MAKLALVYGVRLLPSEELSEIKPAQLVLQDGKTAHVTMHLIEGDNEEELRAQLTQSLDAFFELFPEI